MQQHDLVLASKLHSTEKQRLARLEVGLRELVEWEKSIASASAKKLQMLNDILNVVRHLMLLRQCNSSRRAERREREF